MSVELVESFPDLSEPVSQSKGICVRFNSEKQGVEIDFNTDEFKNWEWVVGALQMAVKKAELIAQITAAESMQRQRQAAFETEALRRNLSLN